MITNSEELYSPSEFALRSCRLSCKSVQVQFHGRYFASQQQSPSLTGGFERKIRPEGIFPPSLLAASASIESSHPNRLANTPNFAERKRRQSAGINGIPRP